MKVVSILLVLLVAVGLGFVLFFMDENLNLTDAFPVGQPKPDETARPLSYPDIGIAQNVDTEADMLEAIGYEYAKNRDTVGWLRVPDTGINNSVVQSHDNLYYLKLNERREADVYGCYYADYECSFGTREELSRNTVIYGHSDLTDKPDGKRFSQLFHFTNAEFAEKTPVIEFATPQELMRWQVFAVFYTDVKMNYIQVHFTDEAFDALVREARQKSIYDYDVQLGGGDKLLTLSTCTIKFGREDTSHRFVVMARLLPKDAEVERASFTVKTTP